jgi:CHAT domain
MPNAGRDRIAGAVLEFLANPRRDFAGLTRPGYRDELLGLGEILYAGAISSDAVARAIVQWASPSGRPSARALARLLRVNAFLEWLVVAGEEDMASLATNLVPALAAEVRVFAGLPAWEPWPRHEVEVARESDAETNSTVYPQVTQPDIGPAIRVSGYRVHTGGGGGRGSSAGGGRGFGITGGGAHGGADELIVGVGGPVGAFDEGLDANFPNADVGGRASGDDSAAEAPRLGRSGEIQTDSPDRATAPTTGAIAPMSFDGTAEVGEAYREEGPGVEEIADRVERPGEYANEGSHEAFGKLVAPDMATVGEAFELEVGLSKKRPQGTAGGQLQMPALELTPYAIDLQLVADSFDIGTDESFRQRIEVSSESPYPSVTVHLTPRPQRRDKTSRTIQVTFGSEGETIGVAIRTIDVYQRGSTIRRRPRRVAAVRGISVGVPKGETKADITLEIFQAAGALRWGLRSTIPGVAFAADSTIRKAIRGSPRDFAAQIGRVVERYDPSTIGSILLGAGREIGVAVPSQVWDALRRAHRAVQRPLDILILSEEPYVPWELAVPPKPLVPGGAATFLGAEANVGRWLLGEPPPASVPPRKVAARTMGVIRGIYRGPTFPALPGAGKEFRELRRLYGAQPVAPSSGPIRDLLKGTPAFDVIHFAVHGAVDQTGSDDGLILAETPAGHAPFSLIPNQVRGSTLSAGAPFVFLNACQVGSAYPSLAAVGGLAAAFLRWGAAAVVAPIWAIDDDVSHEVALRIYARGLGANPPTVAALLREARLLFDPEAATASPTYVAYQLYGHPSMRLQR